MQYNNRMEFATRAIHSGHEGTSSTGDVVAPLHLTSTHAYESPGVTQGGFEYIRYGNPTRAALETCLASLENAPPDCPALCFSSGMAATDCAMRLLKPGDHLLIAQDVYGGTMNLAETILRPLGIQIAYADAVDSMAFARAMTAATRMVWIESPSNPLLRITDIAAVVLAARMVGALVVIDSTFATPYLQNPLDLGVDLVMHSTTKYLGGHSDVLGGALIAGTPEMRARLYAIQKTTGAVAAPFDCWLTMRGVRSLAARMRMHQENASALARYLADRKGVVAVHYPGLPTHPQHALAKQQMRGFGGMVSFEVADGETAEKVLKSTRIFALAPSLGGVESIISYPRLMSHAALCPEERQARNISDALIRLSVGIEDIGDLIADIEGALSAADC